MTLRFLSEKEGNMFYEFSNELISGIRLETLEILLKNIKFKTSVKLHSFFNRQDIKDVLLLIMFR